MFKTVKELKSLVQERLRAAAEEIFSLFEQTLKDYEEEVFRFKQQTDLQRWRGKGRATSSPVQLPVQEKDVASELAPSPDKDERERLHIKEEEEEDGLRTAEADSSPSSSSQQCKAEPLLESYDASEANTDCQLSENGDDEQRDSTGFHFGPYRPYTCSICSKTFRIKSILTRHMKTHTGEKPYCCSDCGKSFIHRSYLRTHMNSHSGQKPYTCNFCGRGFTQVGNMNAHIRIHTGEKPHSCTHCGKSFREKADLINIPAPGALFDHCLCKTSVL
uniref:C2H2-type domain-containing protein n=1 Tax=Echeneis naucrates TaxID=173247 RepID=A0A665UBG9_ECHNA